MENVLSLNLNQLKKAGGKAEQQTDSGNQVKASDIAIIGLESQVGKTNTSQEFWEALESQEDLLRAFPDDRLSEVTPYLEKCQNGYQEQQMLEKSYLNSISKFDAKHFNILPTDVVLMDPAQRLILETTWKTMEDAGYTPERLSGTKTGVFVGNTVHKKTYFDMIQALDPDLSEKSLAGTLNAVLASRLSYLLNLKGPSIVVDTACSSSLVAVHLACQSLISGESELAIAAGVKLDLIPEFTSEEDFIGITSTSGRARTFDDLSDGATAGEGIGVIMLKPLAKALQDGDRVRAVIKGSAVGQDGRSMGITAPNSASQKEVILEAWEKAAIHPESISYIEAHGTATKLGDPIELTGIDEAFKEYTNQQQFCAIASVKTNVGHLDCAAGMIGLIKAVLSLENKKIPANLHFTAPNRNIDFINSAVYINDELKKWEKSQTPRRCGVSSFGIGGTNCHVVLEEGPEVNSRQECEEKAILTLSGKSKDALRKKLEEFRKYLMVTDHKLTDICYSFNMGKSQEEFRFAMELTSKTDYLSNYKKISQFEKSDTQYIFSDNLFHSDLQKLDQMKLDFYSGEIGIIHKELVNGFIQGEAINWELFYQGKEYKKVRIPTIVFEGELFWPKQQSKKINHPLFDYCIKHNSDQMILQTTMSIQSHVELKEHVIGQKHVLAGTVYVEMINYSAKTFLKTEKFEIENLTFLTPLICEKDENKIVQTIVTKEKDYLSIKIESSTDGEKGKTIHVETTVRKKDFEAAGTLDLEQLIAQTKETILPDYNGSDEYLVTLGPRWNTQKEIYLSDDYVISCAEIDTNYKSEIQAYTLYPSLLDPGVNSGNSLNPGVDYLPFIYGKARFYEALPSKIYSYIKRVKGQGAADEINVYDIKIVDPAGKILAEITDYSMKKIHEATINQFKNKSNHQAHHFVDWIQTKENVSSLKNKKNLIIRSAHQADDPLITEFQKLDEAYLECVIDSDYGQISQRENNKDIADKAMLEQKLHEIQNLDSYRLIYLLPRQDFSSIVSVTGIIELIIKPYFDLVKILSKMDLNQAIDLVILTDIAFTQASKNEFKCINAALAGMIESLNLEMSKVSSKVISFDYETRFQQIRNEFDQSSREQSVMYLKGNRYIKKLEEIELSVEPTRNIKIEDEGIYLITGGLGGMGLKFAEYLANKNPNAHIALLSRQKFPSRNQWHLMEQVTEEHQMKINKIRQLEKAGATIEILQFDVSKEEKVVQVITYLKEIYGKVKGVFHGAGLSGNGFLYNKSWETFDQVIASKINGTLYLDQILRKEPLDFFYLFSSASTIFPSPGQSDYLAGNAFLNAFAKKRHFEGANMVSINWGGWEDVGMASKLSDTQKEGFTKFMTSEEALQYFDEIFGVSKPVIMIGELDYSHLKKNHQNFTGDITLSERIQRKIKEIKVKNTMNMEQSEGLKSTDFIVTGKTEGGLTETEVKIATIWHTTLGIKELEYDAKFLEIGGDSLTATFLQKEIEKVYPGMMDISDIFSFPSIKRMSEYIVKRLDEEKEEVAIQTVEAGDQEYTKLFEQLAAGEIDVELLEQMI